MKLSLSGRDCRVFAKAIHSLAKFASELYVEADHTTLSLRAFNISKSAMGTFRFSRQFFETFNISGNPNECYFKISMKTILPVFKHMKQVERCDMHLQFEQSKLKVKFKCRSDITKTVLISTMDEENCLAAVSMDKMDNVISGTFKIFSDISNNFHAADLEMSLEVIGNCLTAKNYIEGTRVSNTYMKSQLKIGPSEFEIYDVKNESAITFSMKEFRSFLQFAENIGERLTLKFNQAGEPVFLTTGKPGFIESTLVMSTVIDADVSMLQNAGTGVVATPKKRKQCNTKPNSIDDNVPKKRISDETTLSNTSTLFHFNSDNNTRNESLDEPRNTSEQNGIDDAINDIFLAAGVAIDTNTLQQDSLQHNDVIATFASTESNNRTTVSEDEHNTIPQSPQKEHRVKLRSIFSRCFESTYIPREPSPSSQIFVANSDVED